jgi:hypothetical protein
VIKASQGMRPAAARFKELLWAAGCFGSAADPV